LQLPTPADSEAMQMLSPSVAVGVCDVIVVVVAASPTVIVGVCATSTLLSIRAVTVVLPTSGEKTVPVAMPSAFVGAVG
jgi:hypothetical protein